MRVCQGVYTCLLHINAYCLFPSRPEVPAGDQTPSGRQGMVLIRAVYHRQAESADCLVLC